MDIGVNTRTSGFRTLSFFEFVLGAAIVVAHNVYHAVPNEVPILFVLGIVSIRLRNGSWRALGFGRPKSWLSTILFAIVAAAAVIAGQFATEPLAAALGLAHHKSAATAIGLNKNDLASMAKALAISWTFAAFGEEFGYRRYLLGRGAEALGGTYTAYSLSLFAVSALFGIGHFYQGPAGMFGTAVDGFLLGAAYLLSGRNLWVPILAHGLVDTVAFAAVVLGLAD